MMMLMVILLFSYKGYGQTEKPNIVFIFLDDLGYYGLRMYGGSGPETPEIDRLRDSGIKFNLCHVRAMCVPSRQTLLSGRHLYELPGGGISSPALSGLLKQEGYATGFCGKWMLDNMPWEYDFDEGVIQVNWYRYWGPHLMVWNSGGYLREYNLDTPLPRGMKDFNIPTQRMDTNAIKAHWFDGAYGPDMLNKYALDYIERHQHEPFFLYYPLKLPHSPDMPTPETEKTEDVLKAIQASNELAWNGNVYSVPSSRKWLPDILKYIDKLVGNVVRKLETTGIRENSLVVFLSDNGAGKDFTPVQEGIERIPGWKGGILEGATRVPCIISWPKVVKAGYRYDGLLDITDFLPTLYEAAAGRPLENSRAGISHMPVLRGDFSPIREYIYFHGGRHPNPTKWQLFVGRSFHHRPYVPEGMEITPRVDYEENYNIRYVRGVRYKLYNDGRLYDLEKDMHERHPIVPGVNATPESRQAREKLQAVLDSHPEKDNPPVWTP